MLGYTKMNKLRFEKYNLFRISGKGGEVTPLSNDFFLSTSSYAWHRHLYAKNSSLLVETYGIGSYHFEDWISWPSAELKEDENCLNLNASYCSECYCTTLNMTAMEKPEEPYKFVIIPNAPVAVSYVPVLALEPVLPALHNAPAIVKAGAEWYRTYTIKGPDGAPLKGVQITSASGIQSRANDDGIIVVGNRAPAIAGTYEGKTLKDVIATVAFQGKVYDYVFHNRHGGGETFNLVVEPAGLYEKRIDLVLGGKGSIGIGAFRFGTVKAATLDLEASAASGIAFTLVDDAGALHLEMERHLTAGLGVNAVLAEADLIAAHASAGAGLALAAVGSQHFQGDDPFAEDNTASRAVVTAFIWDTLIKNGTLFFPSAGLVLNWIWENVRGDGLAQSRILQSAGLQVEGSASAGVEIPALAIGKGGSELSGSNLDNLGISLPSVSGSFLVEGYLHDYEGTESPAAMGVEFSITTAMEIDAGIFDGISSFAGLPDLPTGSKATFDTLCNFDAFHAPQTLSLSYMTEDNGSGDRIQINETQLVLDAGQLSANLSRLPPQLRQLVTRENLSDMTWNVKRLNQLYRQSITAAAEGVTGEFNLYQDLVADTSYAFEIGLGLGLNFGVGAHINYLEHERALQKKYRIDSLAQGMSLVEDQTMLPPRFPPKSLKDILGLTLDYLKDQTKALFTTVKQQVFGGSETTLASGNTTLTFAPDALAPGTQVVVSRFTPLSSGAGSVLRKMRLSQPVKAMLTRKSALDSTSATIGECVLINLLDASDQMLPSFAPGTLTIASTETLDGAHADDADDDGIPDSEDDFIDVATSSACSCGQRQGIVENTIDFVNCYTQTNNDTLILHDIGVLAVDAFSYYWLEFRFNPATMTLDWTGNFGEEDKTSASCNCGLRAESILQAISFANAYIEPNIGHRLTLHDLAIADDQGAIDYYWANLIFDMGAMAFRFNGEFGLE